MEHARPPAELSLEGGPAVRSEAWRKWRKLFEVFLKASGVSKEPKEVQASLLVNLIGSAGYEVFTTFTFESGDSEDDVKCVLKKFDSYFGAKPNITVRRYKFFTRSQEEGENIDQYMTALRVLSQQCEFGELNESLLRDKIVCGINNSTVRDRLLRSDDLTLNKAMQICQAAEMSKEESQCISTSENVQVNAVQTGGSMRGTRRTGGRRRGAGGGGGAPRGAVRAADGAGAARAADGAGPARGPCRACGNSRCVGGERCPARNAMCFVCDRKGHFSRVCEQKKAISKVLNLSVDCAASESEDDSEEMFYVNVISEVTVPSKSCKGWHDFFLCNGEKVVFKIDTGSMLNVLSKNEYLNLGLSIKNLKPFAKRVLSFTGNRLPIIGTDNVSFTYKNKYYVLPFVVADLNCQNVLGLEGSISLGLISCVDTINIHQYDDLFEGLGKIPGEYSISVDKSVQPVVCPTRKIAFGLKDKLLNELHRMESLGVVRKVTHPTDWVNAIVLVAKKDGSIRVCLDPRPLNLAVRRAQYSLPTVPELAVRLRGASVFSVLDARCGFWMVQIDDASADLCTFSTPFGRYQFLRLQYGINCAPDVFHARLRQHLEDLEGVESFIDDVIVWGQNKDEHDKRLGQLLQRAREIGIKFNRDKCKFGVPEITYLGHKFDSTGMRADDSKVKAIMEMPYPNDRKSLERFLGMVNYLSKFIHNYSKCVNVLRSLLKKDSEWVWEHHHSSAVDELKHKLASAPVLALYCERTPLVLSVDASSVALGAVLLQEGRPVEFASLTLTDTQTRYAQIEKEMLAIVFAVERFRQYIYGRSDVTVQTDHKPLEALFNKPLVSVPARLQRMMMRVQGFDIKVVYMPGKYMYIADTLSRAPLKELMHDRVTEEVDVQTCFMLVNVPFSDQKMEAIRKETETDRDCRLLIKNIMAGWPKNRRDTNTEINVFWPYREQLHYIDGIIFKGECIFIPHALRDNMISRVHEGHLGIERCKRRAREVMFWPGLNQDVERAVRGCTACALHAPRARRQPLLQHDVPALPWHKLASDIFEYRKRKYIILVDYFSNYVEVGELSTMSTKQVVNFMREQFARHGIPSELITDNGPAYSSQEFKIFMREWEVRHVTSSPLYPQSNGKSERTVQTVKNLLKKCVDSGQDFSMGLLNYRATPRNGLDSPAQILMGRRLNTKLPVNSKLLTERVDNERNYQALMANRVKVKTHYDRSARSLEHFSPGDKATLICNGTRKSVAIVARAPEPRSYVVEDESGGRYRRSRSHLVSRSSAGSAGQSQKNTITTGLGSTPNMVWMAGVRRRRSKKVTEKQQVTESQVIHSSGSTDSSPQSACGENQPGATEHGISNNDRDESPGTDGNVSPEPPDRPPGKVRQVHPEDKTQMLAYDSTYRKKNKPKSLPIEDNHYNHLANTNVAMSPMYPLTPNICVEGGKIEFIKSPPSSARNSLALASPPQTPLLARRGSREKRDVRIYDEPSEKFDGDKELLEKRIKQLEAQLEEEKRRTQRERMAVTKLQNKLIKREGAARSDAERERRARGDWEARARAAEADAARLAGKLHAAQREIARMEETVRTLLQYKSRVETLKQEKASLSSALESSAAHYQSQLSTLTAENERLRGQLTALTVGLGGDHEKRLDDVAQQVVRALLTQKSVREELGCARARVRELEAQNRALSTLLVRQLRPQQRPSPATPHTPLTPHTPGNLQVHLVDVGSCGSLVSFRDSPPPSHPAPQPHPLSQDDKRRHQILADIWTELKGLEVTPANLARALSAVDPTLWAAPARPATLSINMPQPCTDPVRGESVEKVTEEESGEACEAGAESPESGAKDEGYSTMSSDVQADASRQSDHAADRALPDLNEASDETDNQTIVSINPRESRRHARLLAEADYMYFPIGVAFAGVRGSYPPSRPILPFQHVVRSFSDSHLCLKLLAGTTCPSSCLDSPTPSSGVLVLDLKPALERPLRRPAIASTTSSERVSWGSTLDDRGEGSQYDADYIQHWLELDDARSALQQRHRDLADLEYDRAELEDWSLSLSCEDLRDRQSPFAEITTPGQISLSTLPSIREDDALELEEDVGDCLWNDCGFANVEIEECRIDELESSEKRWECTGTNSPGGSWSSASDAPDKRSNTAMSEDGDCAVGLDFTRDFYRLVKYESTKSLASNSSRGMPQDAGNHLRIHDVQAMALHDREHALQNVLHFIAEQQKYCRDREESDSTSSRPVSEIRELPPPYATADFDDDSVGPRSEVSEDRQRPDSFGSFSENDSSDVISDRPRVAFDSLSEPRSTPRFIEREDPYVESEGYYDDARVENAENEIDEHHLIKVQRKNEINRIIDATSSTEEEPCQIKEERPEIECSRLDSALKENTVNIMLNKVPNEKVDEETLSMSKSSSFPFTTGDAEMSLVEEVLSACRRSSGALVTVPEEEEGSSPETSSPQMTESNTTSTSTAETVIVSNKNERDLKSKSDKSRIPKLLGGKRPPSSPNKVRSKIPVSERLRVPTTLPTSNEPIIVKQEHKLSFHEAATSKDVIEELNRMIRQSEGAAGTETKVEDVAKGHGQKDSALWAPTGWVHVEKDIDFSDPKARANLLDVMLASSDSSPSSCSSSPAEPPPPAPAPAPPYSRLHRLHRSRRQKTAAALRSRGLAVLRFPRHRRPSIIGRDGFFVRYGDRERAAVHTFDFLDDLSGGSSPEATKDCINN